MENNIIKDAYPYFIFGFIGLFLLIVILESLFSKKRKTSHDPITWGSYTKPNNNDRGIPLRSDH